MIHGVHRFQIYTKRWHRLLGFLLIIVPFGFLVLIGRFESVDMGSLASALGISLYRLTLGYLISLVLGVGAALLIGASPKAEAVIPVLDVMQNVPSFALIPVFALLFGYTSAMAILFVATSVLWPILFYCLSAIRTARTDWEEAATVFGATGWKRTLHYLLPVSAPAIITGSIVGLSIGWEAIIGVEIIGLTSGIGPLLNSATLSHNSSVLIAGIALLLLLVFCINRLLWAPLLRKTRAYAE